MTPTIATLVTTADRAAQNHAEALQARQAAHEAYAAERVPQLPATALPAPGYGQP